MTLMILTNILTPYRKFMYDEIYKYMKDKGDSFFVLVMSDGEPGRHWKYNEYKASYTILLRKFIINKSNSINGYFSMDLRKRLRNIHPDIVIAGGAYIMLPVIQAILYRKQLKYRLLFWSESNLRKKENIPSYKYIIRDNIRKIMYKCFDGFWNAGKYSNDFISKYCKKNVVSFFMPNLIESNLFKKYLNIGNELRRSYKEKYHVSEGKKILFSPIRLSYEKGLLEFLELFKESKCCSDVILLIAGDGPLRGKIKEKIKNINSDIRLLGYRNQDEILELYTISDIFLLPSLIDPNPLSCVEALHVGLPLLISEHVGNSIEVVEQNINGYIFSYHNYIETIGYIDKIVSNDENWFKCAKQKSFSIANSIYNPKITIPRCINEMKLYFNKN